VHERLIQVFPFERRHPSVLSSFSVEDEIRCDDRASNDRRSVKKLLREVSAIAGVGGFLHVCPFEGILERCLGFTEGG